MLYIGVDLGTSSVKMILCDEKGNVLNTVTKEYPIYYPCDGYSEQNPEDWYEQTAMGLREITEGAKGEISGLSIAGQMHGLVMLDEEDRVIRPAILWNDSRSCKECDYLNGVVGTDKLTDMTANIAFPGFTAPKILWVKENEPENFKRCRKIMLPKDYIVYRLTGKFVSEPSDASGLLLYDVKNNCYSEEMLKICNISEDMLPEIHNSFEAVGKVKEEVGIGSITLAPGGGDNAAAAVGMGVVHNGMCSVSLGTSGTVFIACDEFSKDNNNALHAFCHANGKYHLMGCILSAASCNKWWIEDILNSKDYNEFRFTADGESKVFYLPYMMGERSPHNDPYARGAFVGMSLDTKRGDMAKAVMEGVAYALRDCVEIARSLGIDISCVRVCGGGAKSHTWCEILANVLRARVVKCESEEGPALGAAVLAMVAAGEYPCVESAADSIVRVKECIDYNLDYAKKYDAGYLRYKNLYKSLKDWYRNEEQSI